MPRKPSYAPRLQPSRLPRQQAGAALRSPPTVTCAWSTRSETAKSSAQKALEKLGLKRDIDLALHLPLRYEDETRITKLRDAREGDSRCRLKRW